MKEQPPLEELLKGTRRVLKSEPTNNQEPLGSVLVDRILSERRATPTQRPSIFTVEKCSLIGAACAVCLALGINLFNHGENDSAIGDLWMEYSEVSP